VNFVCNAIENVTHKAPGVGTDGGNSDALSIREIADVVEVGSLIAGAHIVDEFISEEELVKLRRIYLGIIDRFKDLV
jgi:succinyl-diaminopimelate desuccinylase